MLSLLLLLLLLVLVLLLLLVFLLVDVYLLLYRDSVSHAATRQSARISLPSASVLVISEVFPFLARITSPGLVQFSRSVHYLYFRVGSEVEDVRFIISMMVICDYIVSIV